MGSRRRAKDMSPGCAIAFCAPFVVIGIAVFVWLAVIPVMQSMGASDWIEVPCTITQSRVDTLSDSDGSTYKVDIRYQYTYEGVQHLGDRYDFSTVYSSGYESKAEVVRQHPVGSEVGCWVDPDDPSASVIDRGVVGDVWIGALFGLIFAGAGVFAMVMMLRQQRRKAHFKSTGVATLPPLEGEDGFLILKPESTPLRKVVVLSLVALVACGLTGFLIKEAFLGSRKQYLLLLFIIPFGAVACVCLVGVVRGLLSLFSPKPTVTLRSKSIRPGASVEYAWELVGGTNRVERVRMDFVGRETTTIRSGDSTRTKKRELHRQSVADIERGDGVDFGDGTFDLDESLPPTSVGDDVEIQWCLETVVELRAWPDLKQRFEIPVRPRR